ncbi:MAG: TetR/AcrR family transcriptional regulator, partial [Candidatus Rokuibacteriota bacterium]
MRGAQGLLHEEIIRVGALCFSAMGYRATTLNTIAAKVGISKVTLYKHVPSKEELLCRMFERTIRSFRSGLRQIVETPIPPDEKLRRIIRYQVTQVATQLPLLRVFFSEEGSLPAAMARRVAREKREYDRAVEGVVREGIAEGRVRKLP